MLHVATCYDRVHRMLIFTDHTAMLTQNTWYIDAEMVISNKKRIMAYTRFYASITDDHIHVHICRRPLLNCCMSYYVQAYI